MNEETYSLQCNGHNFVMTISEPMPRFEDEGIIEEVSLFLDETEIYRDTFGRERAISFLMSNINIDNFNSYIESNNNSLKIDFGGIKDDVILENEYLDEFKNWVVESLTPISKKRIVKISRIKTKLLERSNIYYEK